MGQELLQPKFNKATLRELGIAELVSGKEITLAQRKAIRLMQAETISDKAEKQKIRAAQANTNAKFLDSVAASLTEAGAEAGAESKK